ncbi:hypothetical protein EFK50_20010 [Nocardioides marmoriginsengisoli]|uniref:Uncharacterized protein n=1 Tax=Nocardioides marmoriginsengisoli TaxID=661483 RepID=A0A3N0CBG9_9ACTN|nr:hypothetical protein [Nocardioides marmoriginsengisoli]RNL60601.1 hypothetical protein EFK50_20010 [Nocardioides marmoriginsengisoli]
MKKSLLTAPLLGMAGLLAVGVLAIQSPSSADNANKRDEDSPELVLVADDDDDDTNDRLADTRSRDTRNTGVSRSTRDHTRSNFTKVSRDRDLSRSDKTRDWTRDGGDRTRDRSANLTNDRSRNDTRR